MSEEVIERSPEVLAYWEELNCRFPAVDRVFDECMIEAKALLTKDGIDTYIDSARFLGKMGRGAEPILLYLEKAPTIASIVGEEILPEIKDFCYYLSKNTNFKAIPPFLHSLTAVTRSLHSYKQLNHYLDILKKMLHETSVSVQGHHTTFPSPGLPLLMEQAPRLLSQVSLEGFRN